MFRKKKLEIDEWDKFKQSELKMMTFVPEDASDIRRITEHDVKMRLNSLYGKDPQIDIPSMYPQMAIYTCLGRQNGKTAITRKMIEHFMKDAEKENNDMFWSKKNPYLAEEKLGDQQLIITPKFEPEPEEWIWVDGYKGTQADMTCHGYQYIMNQRHNMEDGAEIVECQSGFHLCKKLTHVFNYYKIGNGRRFFKVRALVRKKDYEKYGIHTSLWGIGVKDKLVAKSIIFERELTPDEIFAHNRDVSAWSQEDKLLALEHGIDWVDQRNKTNELVKLGYSEYLAAYFAGHCLYDKAYALGTQEGLSMDMKIFAIMVED